MSSRRIHNISEVYCKDGYTSGFASVHFWEIMVSVQNLQSDNSFPSFSFSLYYTV